MAIQLTDKLYAATGSKIIADAEQIAGGYMSISSSERHNLTSAQKVIGTLVFETDTGKTYRYCGVKEGAEHWQETIIESLAGLKENFVSKQGDSSIVGNINITGNLTVSGSQFISELENVVTPQNTITLREGATTSLLPGEYTGLIAKNYDGSNNGVLAFDYNGTAYVGDEGDIQPLTTRSDEKELKDGHLLRWDAERRRLVDSGKSLSEISTDDISEGSEIWVLNCGTSTEVIK